MISVVLKTLVGKHDKRSVTTTTIMMMMIVSDLCTAMITMLMIVMAIYDVENLATLRLPSSKMIFAQKKKLDKQ